MTITLDSTGQRFPSLGQDRPGCNSSECRVASKMRVPEIANRSRASGAPALPKDGQTGTLPGLTLPGPLEISLVRRPKPVRCHQVDPAG